MSTSAPPDTVRRSAFFYSLQPPRDLRPGSAFLCAQAIAGNIQAPSG